MNEPDIVSASMIRALGELAGLPLTAGREAVISPILNAWLRDANALSLKMSAPEYIALVPATAFRHPGRSG